MAPPEMLLAAAGSADRIGEILSALFPPAAMAVVFVLICRAALRSTDWKKHEDGAYSSCRVIDAAALTWRKRDAGQRSRQGL